MLFTFFWKEMSWILFFHLLFPCHKIIFRETSYILLHHGIRNTFPVLGTNTNNFWWCPAQKECACANGTPCQKVTEGLRKQCTVTEVSKYVVRVRCKNFFEFVTILGMSRLFKSFEFGNGSRMSDENLVILEFKYLQNKK